MRGNWRRSESGDGDALRRDGGDLTIRLCVDESGGGRDGECGGGSGGHWSWKLKCGWKLTEEEAKLGILRLFGDAEPLVWIGILLLFLRIRILGLD